MTVDDDGLLTDLGWNVASQYATFWLTNLARNLTLERIHPKMADVFYGIRSDVSVARRYAPASVVI